MIATAVLSSSSATFAASKMLGRSSRSILSRQIVGKNVASVQAATFSSNCEPAIRLREAISSYRQKNYTQEIPSRFKKELLSPYASQDGSLKVDDLNRLLTNIGYSDVCLTAQEQNELLRDAGCAGRNIPVSKMMELID